jgi:hypothetical protein
VSEIGVLMDVGFVDEDERLLAAVGRTEKRLDLRDELLTSFR